MTRQIKRYSKEFQEEAIQLALRSKSIDQTARDLGIPISTLHGWVHRLSRKQHPVDIQDAKALHVSMVIEKGPPLAIEKAPTWVKKKSLHFSSIEYP